MTLLLRKQSFLCFILVLAALFGGIYNVTGVKPQIRFYFKDTAEGDVLIFESHQPNLSNYSTLFPKVKYICAQGWWILYRGVNYLRQFNTVGRFSESDSSHECINKTDTIQSFRYWESNETTINGLSLYSENLYAGNEILVEEQARTDIPIPIISVAATGNSDWKLFEGPHLGGKSVCIQVPQLGQYYYHTSNIGTLNLTTIGSVFKGCNILEIEEYRRQNNLMLN